MSEHTHLNHDLGSLAKLVPQPITLQTNINDDLFSGDTVWCTNCKIAEPTLIKGVNGGKYTLWTIEFETVRGARFKVRKRYNDFDRLRSRIDKYTVQTELPKFPPRTGLFQDRFDPALLESRRKALEYWLSSVILNPSICSRPEVKDFVLGQKLISEN
uniref:PX domain-containing protein n=1 Tax=Ogataea thermomethanolica (nom. inval.) TaxID=310468 RepID=A0A7R6UXJ6_9ASCO|nr:PX domain-containing protein [Ogataea thermomethanolica (nom. inval.)]